MTVGDYFNYKGHLCCITEDEKYSMDYKVSYINGNIFRKGANFGKSSIKNTTQPTFEEIALLDACMKEGCYLESIPILELPEILKKLNL